MSKSKLETSFAHQCRVLNLPAYEREYKFCAGRRWRFDFAWPESKVAVELEGGVYTGGRHTRGSGYEADLEKYNTAVSLGWQVLRGTMKHLKDGSLVFMVESLLKSCGPAVVQGARCLHGVLPG